YCDCLRRRSQMIQLIEMDTTVPLAAQMRDEGGPVVLVNTLSVDAAEADRLVEAWQQDAAHFKPQPGFPSTPPHRGNAGSRLFLNYAVWETAGDFARAFQQPAIREAIARYPSSAVASPHLFRKIAVRGICVE